MKTSFIITQVFLLTLLVLFSVRSSFDISSHNVPTKKQAAVVTFVEDSLDTDPFFIKDEFKKEVPRITIVSVEVTEFLEEVAQDRLMDMEQAKLAKELGTSDEIKNYGALMLEEQAKLNKKIQALARNRQIPLKKSLTQENLNVLNELKEKRGKDFDKKFIKTIRADLKRDLRKARKAANYKDKAVSNFSKEYITTIQAQLKKVNALKKNS